MAVRVQSPLGWLPLVCFVSVYVLAIIVAASEFKWRRRVAWEMVLEKAHRWAESSGGKLLRVTEESPVWGTRGTDPIARRYRVIFADQSGLECVALLRYTPADGCWSFEGLSRERAESPAVLSSSTEVAETIEPSKVTPAQLAAESYERRHRGRESNVPVIFARERAPKKPRRST
jgi:hypothetical protein